MERINIPMKLLRAQVISDYLEGKQCFCFSCGNSSRALRMVGVDVIGISPYDKINTNTYISPKQAQAMFKCFNATSGSLPLFLIEDIADKLQEYLPHEMFTDTKPIYVPVGSGETLFTFSHIFPIKRLIGVVDKSDPATSFNPKFSTLHDFISTNYKIIVKKDMPLSGYQIKITDYRGKK